MRRSGAVEPFDWSCPEGFTLETLQPDGKGGLYLVARDRTIHRAKDGAMREVAVVGSASGAVALGTDGSLYLGTGDTLRRVKPDGEVEVLATGLGDVYGVALDGRGVAWVTDWAGGRLLRLPAGGEVEVVARDLRYPSGLAFDAAGALYVKESGRQENAPMRVIRFAPDGARRVLVTIAREW